MLATTAIVALSRKIKDERDRKRQTKQALLQAGDSEAAKQAFSDQASTGLSSADNIARSNTQIRFEQPDDVTLPESAPGVLEIPGSSRTGVAVDSSPKGDFTSPSSPATASSTFSPRDQDPPPYSRGTPMSSVCSIDSPAGPRTLSSQDSDTQSVASSERVSVTADSQGTRGIRIRTKGTELKSGFPYHSSLFDLHVRPNQWERFTSQLLESTKFAVGDYGQMWGAATATALTGALLTSVYVGRSMNRSLQEKKVRAGLQDQSDGGLGTTLRRWNEGEFHDLGLFVHLELSESAMKRQNQKRHSFRKPTSFYSRREDRERKAEERKFCIVVTKLDEEGEPSEAIHHELSEESARVLEMSDPGNVIYEIPELPGDERVQPAELPAGISLGYTSKWEIAPPSGYAELESDTAQLLEKTSLDKEAARDEEPGSEGDGEEDATLKPAPLMVTAETHAALNKEVT